MDGGGGEGSGRGGGGGGGGGSDFADYDFTEAAVELEDGDSLGPHWLTGACSRTLCVGQGGGRV